MGFLLRVRLASFFTGAAASSSLGLYILYNDYKTAHHAVSNQMNSIYGSLDSRISALEKLKADQSSKEVIVDEASKEAEAT
ncbi:hypothetical protein Leryth_012197 [Lithospermum erythrorhizon]|uniref:Uncharacterized protein n=1 Tax=Lithospermum erythrorhizon TaxID=34254 RepID=A0AAV3R5R4_LITER|nr:hypothetical protein Leryth_012197 [Lithospermum erythrorhizon]